MVVRTGVGPSIGPVSVRAACAPPPSRPFDRGAMPRFKGWTAGALWEDTKFAAKHFNDIDRIAVVGESRWQRGVAVFFKPYTAADVRYFDMAAVKEARRWIRST